MTISPHLTGPGGEFSPQALLDALRESGTTALAEALGDLAVLLRELAGDPGAVFELEGRARGDFTHLLGTLQECLGALDALEARSVVALRDITRRERYAAARDQAAHESAAEPSRTVSDETADRITTQDVSLITRRSPHRAGRTVASAQRLVETLPRMLTAMRTGQIGSDAAYAVADAASVLDPDLAREVDRELGERLADFDGAGTRRWRDAVATLAGALDPDGEKIRHRRARAQRHVTMTPGKHGMATVSARVPALEARQIHKQLSLEAERRRSKGGRQGHGALMADAFLDTFLSRGDGTRAPLTLELGVIITDRALFRPDVGDAAHLEGYGAVPVEAVREQLRAATTEPKDPADDPFGKAGPAVRTVFRRLYMHPTSGELVAMDATSREFPAAMKRFLTWRDTSCRGPYCNASLRHCDHIVPVSRGGPTSLVNGEWLCVRCNAKELSAASVERSEGTDGSTHRVVWTGHSGVRRTTTPTPLLWETAPRPRNTPTEEGPAKEKLPEENPPEEDSASATSAAERPTEEHLVEEAAPGEAAAPERPLAEELSADDPEDAGPPGEVTGDDGPPGPRR